MKPEETILLALGLAVVGVVAAIGIGIFVIQQKQQLTFRATSGENMRNAGDLNCMQVRAGQQIEYEVIMRTQRGPISGARIELWRKNRRTDVANVYATMTTDATGLATTIGPGPLLTDVWDLWVRVLPDTARGISEQTSGSVCIDVR